MHSIASILLGLAGLGMKVKSSSFCIAALQAPDSVPSTTLLIAMTTNETQVLLRPSQLLRASSCT